MFLKSFCREDVISYSPLLRVVPYFSKNLALNILNTHFSKNSQYPVRWRPFFENLICKFSLYIPIFLLKAGFFKLNRSYLSSVIEVRWCVLKSELNLLLLKEKKWPAHLCQSIPDSKFFQNILRWISYIKNTSQNMLHIMRVKRNKTWVSSDWILK